MIITKTVRSKNTDYKNTKEWDCPLPMSKAIEKINELAAKTQANNPSSTIQHKGNDWIQVSTKNIWITYEVWGEFNVRDN